MSALLRLCLRGASFRFGIIAILIVLAIVSLGYIWHYSFGNERLVAAERRREGTPVEVLETPVAAQYSVRVLSTAPHTDLQTIHCVGLKVPHELTDSLIAAEPKLQNALDSEQFSFGLDFGVPPPLEKNGVASARVQFPPALDVGYEVSATLDSNEVIDGIWRANGKVEVRIHPSGVFDFDFRLESELDQASKQFRLVKITWNRSER